MAADSAQLYEKMPNDIDRERATQLRRILAERISGEDAVVVKMAADTGGLSEIILSPLLARTFLDIARLISSGKSFQIIQVDAELTTQQAADMLNVSRPYFIKLLESGEIPFTKTGRHRRIQAEAVFTYRDRRDSARAHILAEMAQDDAENGDL